MNIYDEKYEQTFPKCVGGLSHKRKKMTWSCWKYIRFCSLCFFLTPYSLLYCLKDSVPFLSGNRFIALNKVWSLLNFPDYYEIFLTQIQSFSGWRRYCSSVNNPLLLSRCEITTYTRLRKWKEYVLPSLTISHPKLSNQIWQRILRFIYKILKLYIATGKLPNRSLDSKRHVWGFRLYGFNS